MLGYDHLTKPFNAVWKELETQRNVRVATCKTFCDRRGIVFRHSHEISKATPQDQAFVGWQQTLNLDSIGSRVGQDGRGRRVVQMCRVDYLAHMVWPEVTNKAVIVVSGDACGGHVPASRPTVHLWLCLPIC
ncbi:hypothetical protein J6590_050407 [Homalodisca vitripennis]|nr:hypothetical protein J6590_050407 [Homalodisca vitripennis]